MSVAFTDDELLAYLDEQLAVERMAEFERSIRDSETLRNRLAEIVQRRESGEHSVGEVWRHHRLSCPTRATLGSFLLGVLEEPLANYIDFHLHTVGCRYCQATLAELQDAHLQGEQTQVRQQRIFESSIGRLRPTE